MDVPGMLRVDDVNHVGEICTKPETKPPKPLPACSRERGLLALLEWLRDPESTAGLGRGGGVGGFWGGSAPRSSSFRRSVVKAMRLRQDQAHTKGMDGQWSLFGRFSHSHTYAKSIAAPEAKRNDPVAWGRGRGWQGCHLERHHACAAEQGPRGLPAPRRVLSGTAEDSPGRGPQCRLVICIKNYPEALRCGEWQNKA